MRRVRYAAFALVALPACLEVPNAPDPECTSNADCNTSAGEVCETGTCWGGPPTGSLAFVLSPPPDHVELVTRELTTTQIQRDGRVDALLFEATANLAARLECVAPLMCDRATFSASVSIARPSLFPGGPGFKASTTSMTSDSTAGGASFSIRVPKSSSGEPFAVTIVPQPRGDEAGNTQSLAELVPPLRTTMTATGTQARTLSLGGLELPTIEGTLLAANGAGLARYRVVALGRWEPGAAATEVSTVAYTGSDGAFRLTLSAARNAADRDLYGPVEIVARPSDPNEVAPTLRLVGVGVPAASVAMRILTQPADLGSARSVQLKITGRDGSGALRSVPGARVRVTAVASGMSSGTAVVADEATSDDSGFVTLALLDGAAVAANYRIDVVPPAAAIVGAVYNAEFPLPPTGLTPEIELLERTRVRGIVLDTQGNALPGVSVTARPAPRFAWNLDDDAQTFLNTVAVSTAVTNDAGEYVLWVDPAIAGIASTYDLSLEPAHSTGALERTPTAIRSGVEIPPQASVATVSVPDILLPDAAFVHGQVLDSAGNPLENADVKVYRVSSDNAENAAVCAAAANAPEPCPSVAQLLGRATTDATGTVELTLPR